MNYKPSLWEKIQSFFSIDISHHWTNFIYGIRNLWKWKRIVWKDRWYDYAFLEDVIIFKLEDMIEHWDDAHYVGSDFTKKRMIVICKKLKEYENKQEQLSDYHAFQKLFGEHDYDNRQYLRDYRKIQIKAYALFGRNMFRFWD